MVTTVARRTWNGDAGNALKGVFSVTADMCNERDLLAVMKEGAPVGKGCVKNMNCGTRKLRAPLRLGLEFNWSGSEDHPAVIDLLL